MAEFATLQQNGPMVAFSTPVYAAPAPCPSAPAVVVETPISAPAVTSDLVVHPNEATRAYLARDVTGWGWEDLRDYVVHEIQARFGVQPRDMRKEMGIFKAYVDRWGMPTAAAIARHAFDSYDGRWKGSPIGVNRFTKGSDPYFSQPICDYLKANHLLS